MEAVIVMVIIIFAFVLFGLWVITIYCAIADMKQKKENNQNEIVNDEEYKKVIKQCINCRYLGLKNKCKHCRNKNNWQED